MRVKVISVPNQGQEQDNQDQPMFALGGNFADQDRKNNAFSLNIGYGQSIYSPLSQKNPFQVGTSLPEAPKGEANTEMEGGETLVRTMPDGSPAHFNINGPSHAEGGVGIKAEPQDFVFSQTKALAIKGGVLENFGKSKDNKKSFVPADIAKQYKVNEYTAILNDPNSDKLQKKTAQMNIDNSMRKLQELSIVQESMKGFPDGVPELGSSKEGKITAKYGGRLPGYQMAGRVGAPWANQDEQNYPSYISNNGYGFTPGNNPNWTRDEAPGADPQPFRYFGQPDEDQPMVNQPGFPQSFPQDNPQGNLSDFATYAKNNPGPSSSIDNPHAGQIETTPSNYKNYGASRGDNMARLAAMYALANTQKYTPYIAPIPHPELVHPTYSSPEREIAALQESASTQSMINALSQDGSRQRSVGSSIQGQLIPALGNVIARSQASNVDIANKMAEKNADTLNKYNFERASRLSQLHGLSNEMDARYRDAINQRLGNVAKVERGVEGDIRNLNALNAMNPNYEYDPRTKTIKFRQGDHNLMGAASATSSSTDQEAAFLKSQIAKYKAAGASPDQAFTAAHRDLTMFRQTTTSHPMNFKANTIRNTSPTYINPNSEDNYGY